MNRATVKKKTDEKQAPKKLKVQKDVFDRILGKLIQTKPQKRNK